MPALTITAVDFVTDQLTIAAHGQLTGNGPAATRNIGGALPAPLVRVTDYWIIRVDDNTVKLATSSANAMAGIAINLTTNGTGTNILEVGIPYRRARTYLPREVDVAAAQLKSGDLNSMQDSLKALHALLTDQPQTIWTAPALALDTKSFFPRPNMSTNWSLAGDIGVTSLPHVASIGAGNADICVSDYMRHGQTLKDLRIWMQGDGAVDVVASVYNHGLDLDGIATLIGTTSVINLSAAAITFVDIDNVNIAFPNEGTRIWLRLNANAAGAKAFLIIPEFLPPS